jgi:hypothetical protein
MCWAHEKRRRYGKPVQVVLPPPGHLDRLVRLALLVAEAKTGDAKAFNLAVDRLRKGALAYAWKLGWPRPLREHSKGRLP